VPVKDGTIQASNFDSYPVLRMSEVPEIHTKIVVTDKPADRHGRNWRCHGGTCHRQRGRPAYRQAASPRADDRGASKGSVKGVMPPNEKSAASLRDAADFGSGVELAVFDHALTRCLN
jgi:hypothetical protein